MRFDEASDPELIVTSRAGDYTNDPVALVDSLTARVFVLIVDELIVIASVFRATAVDSEQPLVAATASSTSPICLFAMTGSFR